MGGRMMTLGVADLKGLRADHKRQAKVKLTASHHERRPAPTQPLSTSIVNAKATRHCTNKPWVISSNLRILHASIGFVHPATFAMAILGTALNGIGALFLTHAYVHM